MADNQKGRRGQDQNQNMNRSGNSGDSSRAGQNQQTQTNGKKESQPGIGKTGNTSSDQRGSGTGNRGNR